MEHERPHYIVRRCEPGEPVSFSHLEEIRISHWLESEKDACPPTGLRLCYTAERLIGRFEVQSEWIRCINTRNNSPVYEDSCVEFFFRPLAGLGYFNFEFNCAGALLSYYIEDWRRTGGAFAGYRVLSEAELKEIAVRSSIKAAALPIQEMLSDWWLEFEIPFRVLEPYVMGAGKIQQQREWRGNLYKCAELSKTPHWGSWAPLREKNFHSPGEFGTLLPAPR